jgi:hypothetical protein
MAYDNQNNIDLHSLHNTHNIVQMYIRLSGERPSMKLLPTQSMICDPLVWLVYGV